jgi:TrmH family RNA methyltransferase
MKQPPITSFSNPLVKEARALMQKKARRESGLFLVEGILHVGEVVEAGWDVQTILYDPDHLTGDFASALIRRCAVRSITLQPVSAQVMESIAEKDNPQGIVAVAVQRRLGLSGIDRGTFRWGAALVSPQDPGNVGTILRTIDAVNADGLILLDGGVDLYHPSVVRASMGTLFWKPVIQASFNEFAQWARDNQYRLIGTSARASMDYRAFARSERDILVLGNEQKGVSAEQLAKCDERLSLPMRGRASSLNLAVAAGVLLYAMMESGKSG